MNERLSVAKKEGHLKEGVKPIFASMGSREDYNDSALNFPGDSELNSALDVDFFSSPSDLREKGFLAENYGYVISAINDSDKLSRSFANCTGLVVAGKDKITGKNISFLSHQNPVQFLHKKKENFINDLKQRLAEIKERCEDGTIDAVVVGGWYVAGSSTSGIPYEQEYIDSVKLLSAEVKQIIDFEPIVINGPKLVRGQDSVYYKNEDRRLYLMRVKVNSNTGDFSSSEIERQKKQWEK
ncbi:MAG: hypothetical protein Q7K54_06580 [Candidatus Parcubacteria bacterium]|nr:hypothetical protein [Candidatus Parcubacteria bacterium]